MVGLPLSCTSIEDLSLEAVITGAIGDATYLWNQGAETPVIDNLEIGDYSVVVTDNLGCTDTETFNLQAQDSITIDFEVVGSACNENAGTITIFDITLSSGNGFSLFLDDDFDPITDLDFPVQLATSAGLHELIIIDDGGCRFEQAFEINGSEPIELIIEDQDPVIINPNESAILNINTNFLIDSISWTSAIDLSCTNCINPLASPSNTTTYFAEVFDIQGCSSTTSVTVIVDQTENVYIPNIFSPNEDGFNDQFYIFGNDSVAQVKEISIFDRWGTQVFFAKNIPSNDPIFGWDGAYRGKKLQPGVFIYYTIIEFVDGSELLIEGDVTLIK